MSHITRNELEDLGEQGELLGLMKARAICSESIVSLQKYMKDHDCSSDERALIATNTTTIRGIMSDIDDVMKNIHEKKR